MIYTTKYRSPLGALTLAAEDEHLTGLWFSGQRYFAQGLPEDTTQDPDHPILRMSARWLDQYFAGERPAIHGLPVLPAGSDFRRRIWRLLMEIPYGEVTTYGELARRLEKPMSAQAIGGAVGHNPISIIIPCHRVLGAGGKLVGYAAGIETKRWLLRHEGAAAEGKDI